MKDVSYRVQGGVALQGDVTISGSKNAALPLIATSVLADGVTTLTNVPRLRDTQLLLEILEHLGCMTAFEGNTVTIDTRGLKSVPIPHELVSKLRGAIVLLGPLLARFGVVEMSYPGGCVLGKRPVGAHIEALVQMGAQDMSTEEVLHLQGTLRPSHVILPEFSVTATENALAAAALLPGETVIDIAACEPHVQDQCAFLRAMGADVRDVGCHRIRIVGNASLTPVSHRVTPDYLEAGQFLLAGMVTRGKVRLHDVERHHLLAFLNVLERAGCMFEYHDEAKTILADGGAGELTAMRVQTNIFPGFPTDLQAPIGVAMTQAKGVSRIHEVLFEGRMAYLYELEKMGAQVEILNSHQALVIGPTPLRGRTVASNDIRAGGAMVLAALCAEGESTITDIRYIERGYENLHEKLRALGAKIDVIEREVSSQ